jgi:hypothetical protein
MAFERIMAEVDQLNLAGDRIEGLAETSSGSGALLSIPGNVRYDNGIGGACGDEAAG